MSRYRCRPILHVIRTCAKSPRNGICKWLFVTIQKYTGQIDRAVDDYFWFLVFNRYEIVTDNVPVECSGFSYEFHCTSRITNQFEVHSFTEAFHGVTENHIVEVIVVRL